MKLLLDTQCWLWAIGAPRRLSQPARAALADSANDVFFSAASGWEIAIKFALGRLPLPSPPESFIPLRLARDGFAVLPVQLAHALRVAALPLLHRDPFDRMLVAQAQLEGLTIVTADPQVLAYPVDTLRAG